MTLENKLLRNHAGAEKAAACANPELRDRYVNELAASRRELYEMVGCRAGGASEPVSAAAPRGRR